jgi:hypothetical protein
VRPVYLRYLHIAVRTAVVRERQKAAQCEAFERELGAERKMESFRPGTHYEVDLTGTPDQV